MSMLKQDSDGDLLITNNSFSLVTGDEELAQRLIQNLRTFFGEWFLNRTLGVPWFQIVFEKGATPAIIESTIKDAILSTKDVAALSKWNPLDLSGARELTIKFEVKSVRGTTLSIEEILP